MENDFIAVMPSNVYVQAYPENKSSHYITLLAKRLELSGRWQVALTEISYNHSWYNVEKNFCKIFATSHNGNETSFRVDPGYYSPSELISTLNDRIGNANVNLLSRFKYNEQANSVQLQMEVRENIIISEKLGYMLGFTNTCIFRGPEQLNPDRDEANAPTLSVIYNANQACDFDYKNHYIYLYCDIIEHQIVGNTYSQLLRCIPTRSQDHGHYVTHEFRNLQYLNLSSNNISSVEISLRTDSGELFRFNSGKTVITLHFKRVL